MTSRRYKKLLMSRGVQRDMAETLVWAARLCGISNAEAWESSLQMSREFEVPTGNARKLRREWSVSK